MRSSVASLVAVGILSLADPVSGAVHVPREVKQAVVFLYGEQADGRYSACTGFLVGIPHKTRLPPHGQLHVGSSHHGSYSPDRVLRSPPDSSL